MATADTQPLSWNEIRDRATAFALEWANETSEDAEAKTFWDDFFEVFGRRRRNLAKYEKVIKKLDGKQGFIDVFWPGTLLAEHKSRGKNLDAAFSQATDYFVGLADHELPKYVIVSDFNKMRLYDLETEKTEEFHISELASKVDLFSFIAGYKKRVFQAQDPVNIKAAERMARLHDKLEESKYAGHQLELMLVRLLFCLFAEDTGIFEEKGSFYDLIELHTKEDGSDLGLMLAQLFQVLDTPLNERQDTLDERFKGFPYVNGQLFSEPIRMASFNKDMRNELLYACSLDWGAISPAIFGSMFQGVMDKTERRNLGAHYTSEENILKALEPLFLEELRSALQNAKGSRRKLREFLDRLPKIRIIDPACGCGNFLILAYRELRRLELDAVAEYLTLGNEQVLDIKNFLKVDVSQFYGIEYKEFPAQVAKVAMWLVDHQMNVEAGEKLGRHYVRLPLNTAANIIHADALITDWEAFLKLEQAADQLEAVYIVGNPPFVGSKQMSKGQRDAIKGIFSGVTDNGILDYVTGWYHKAAVLMQKWHQKKPALNIRTSFVSTNSITQGEQVGPLWSTLLNDFKMDIHFAHRTFKWSNEARKKAAVHCIIVGFGPQQAATARLFEYDKVDGHPHERTVNNISPYLSDGDDTIVYKAQKPLSDVVPMNFGNMPLDGGYLLLTPAEKAELEKVEPGATKFIKRLVDSDTFLSNEARYCLWLVGADPSELNKLPHVKKRIELVRAWRNAPGRGEGTAKFAAEPGLFRDRKLPEKYLVMPGATSERRDYIPLAFLTSDTVPNNLVFVVPDADIFHFGVMSSKMHMVWLNNIGGRLKSDPRYAKKMVYNTFPFPEKVDAKLRNAVEVAAQMVLDERAKFPTASLADLYDVTTMPSNLRKAHQILDQAVDACYQKAKFKSDKERLELLMARYQVLRNALLSAVPTKPTKSRIQKK